MGANMGTPRPERWTSHGALQDNGQNLHVAWSIHTMYARPLSVM